MDLAEDSYERALRIYGSDAEKIYEIIKTQVIDTHTITVYRKRKIKTYKPLKKVVYKF